MASEAAKREQALQAFAREGVALFKEFERSSREEQIQTLWGLACDAAKTEAYGKALKEIAAGEGYYGAQAREYKTIAKTALAFGLSRAGGVQ